MHKIIKKILPFVSIIFAYVIQVCIPDSSAQKASLHPYFVYFLFLIFVLYAVFFIISFINEKVDYAVSYHGPLYAGVVLFLMYLMW